MAEEINMTEESVENPNVETADSSAETPITERPINSLETIASNYKDFSVASDIYQCGCTLFRLLNGVHLKQIKEKDYQSFIPSSLQTIIERATNPDPVQRYKSATDFRIALEQLTVVADWDFNSEGLLVGQCNKYSYSFEEVPKSNGKFEFIAYKCNQESNNRNKMSKFCVKNLTKAELKKKRANFLQSVVKGKIK
jgi:serine/threonine protein kinase